MSLRQVERDIAVARTGGGASLAYTTLMGLNPDLSVGGRASTGTASARGADSPGGGDGEVGGSGEGDEEDGSSTNESEDDESDGEEGEEGDEVRERKPRFRRVMHRNEDPDEKDFAMLDYCPYNKFACKFRHQIHKKTDCRWS